MEFFNTAYIFLAPLLILLSLLANKQCKIYTKNILAIANVLLIFYSVELVRELYAYYQLATIMGFEIYPNNKFVIGWFEIRIILIILLPFLFLIKKISANRWLSLLMLFLLLYEIGMQWIKPSKDFSFTVVNFPTNNLVFQTMHYLSWLMLVYALFWFIKKLPSQTKIKLKNKK